jgi:hypothetical protein
MMQKALCLKHEGEKFMFDLYVLLIFYSWFLKVILYQHITRCKKSLGTTVAAL